MPLGITCPSSYGSGWRLFIGLFTFLVLIISVFTSIYMLVRDDGPLLVNKYYAARTLHTHKVTNAAPMTTSYNSLGLTHPYSDETDFMKPITPASYPVNVGFVPNLYIEKYTRCRNKYYKSDISKEEKNYYLNTVAQSGTVRCVMEDPYGYWMYVNGGSLSILSNINPAVYLSTLLVIYQLSLSSFLFDIMYYDDKKMYKMYADYALLTLYVFVLLYSLSTFSTQTSTWGDPAQKIEYNMNANISSLVYCIIVLAVFYMRKSMRYPYWRYMFFKKDSKGYPMAGEDVTAELGFELNMDNPEDQNLDENDEDRNGPDEEEKEMLSKMRDKQDNQLKRARTLVHYAGVPVNNVYPQFNNVFDPSMTQSTNLNNLRMPGELTGGVGTQGLLMDQSARAAKKWKELQPSKKSGPASNETSVIVSLTVFLGGIANMAMARGVLPETEAQFVVFCVFSFLMLEWARNHLFSYFWYMALHVTPHDAFEKHKQVRVIMIVIDLVSFLLQLFIVIMWQLTMTSLLNYGNDTLRALIVTIVALFLVIRLLSVIGGLIDIFDYFTLGKFSPFESKTLWKFESWLYLLCIYFVVWGVFALNVSTADTPETRLRHEEKLMYNSTSVSVNNNDCSKGIQSVTLMRDVLKNTCSKNQDTSPDPVDMKVFGWTRWWRLNPLLVIGDKQDACLQRSCQKSSLLFCGNGFEMYWGECERSLSDITYPRATWANKVLKSQYAYLGGTSLAPLAV
jgi:hypothetical protein